MYTFINLTYLCRSSFLTTQLRFLTSRLRTIHLKSPSGLSIILLSILFERSLTETSPITLITSRLSVIVNYAVHGWLVGRAAGNTLTERNKNPPPTHSRLWPQTTDLTCAQQTTIQNRSNTELIYMNVT